MASAMGSGRLLAHSAGISPAGFVPWETLEALRILGYDPPPDLRSKGLGEVPLDRINMVVSLIGENVFRILPPSVGSLRIAWDVPDPMGEELDFYVQVGKEIEGRVGSLLDQLLASTPFLLDDEGS